MQYYQRYFEVCVKPAIFDKNCQTILINIEMENKGQIDRKNGDKTMKKIIVSILVIGLLLNMAPAITGETTDAADRPEETTDELAFDAEALVDLIDIDELGSRMESDVYAEDDVIMVVNVKPSQQESIGVEQLTLKKNGQGSLKLVHSVPTYVPFAWGIKIQTAKFLFIIMNEARIIALNLVFFSTLTGEVQLMISKMAKTITGLGQFVTKIKLSGYRDIGTGWGYFKATGMLQYLSGEPIAELWASVKCYNDGYVRKEGETTYY